MKLKVYKHTGEEAGKQVELSDAVFNIEAKDHSVWLDVKQLQANKRQGTHKTKEKGEIVGSTRKLRKQKGTGNARVGSIKSPIFRGGGRIFGPQPRNYGFKLNKKEKQLARKSALTYKAKSKNITILEDFSFKLPKTKDYQKMLQQLKVADQKTLLVLDKTDKNIVLSGRNLPNTQVATADSLNTYDILNANKLLLCEGAIEIITKNLS